MLWYCIYWGGKELNVSKRWNSICTFPSPTPQYFLPPQRHIQKYKLDMRTHTPQYISQYAFTCIKLNSPIEILFQISLVKSGVYFVLWACLTMLSVFAVCDCPYIDQVLKHNLNIFVEHRKHFRSAPPPSSSHKFYSPTLILE